MKKILLIALLAIFIVGVSATMINETDAKKINDTKKIDKKFKVVKTTQTTKIISFNGKNHTLKRVYVKGKYAPKVYKNGKYILVIGAHCTCGKYKWKQSKTKLFENDVRFVSNGKSIPKSKNFKILFNPKGVADGEFTIRNKGTRHHDLDLCFFCGRDKSGSSKKYYMKQLY